MADSATLKDAVFSVLKNYSDYETLPFSNLRQHLEQELGLPHKSLREQKGEIMDLVLEYKESSKSEKHVKERGKAFKGGYKTGKYSKIESDIIMTAVQEYMDANGLTPADICPALRETAKWRKYNDLWESVAELLPDRQATVCSDINALVC